MTEEKSKKIGALKALATSLAKRKPVPHSHLNQVLDELKDVMEDACIAELVAKPLPPEPVLSEDDIPF